MEAVMSAEFYLSLTVGVSSLKLCVEGFLSLASGFIDGKLSFRSECLIYIDLQHYIKC